jgi:hypothetical protein
MIKEKNATKGVDFIDLIGIFTTPPVSLRRGVMLTTWSPSVRDEP